MRLLFLIGVLALHVTLISCALRQANDTNLLSSRDAKPSRTRVRVPPSLAQKNRGYRIVTRLAKKFSLNFFQKMARWDVKSEVLSPLSFFIPLSMLSYGARGPTKQRFLSTIGLRKSESQIAKFGYKKLIDNLSRYNIRVRTKIFYAAHLRPQPFFINLATKVFKADIEAVPFDDEYISPEKFNGWVEKQTDNKCTELFKEPLKVGPKPSIVLVNAVYFKGVWQSPFDRSLTTQRPFHIFGGSPVNISTMHKFSRMPYGRIESLHASFVELPYESRGAQDAMSMFVILPDYKGMINEIVGYLDDLHLKDLLKAEMRDVDLYLPKFKFEWSEDLSDKLDRVIGKARNPFKTRPQFSDTARPLKSMSFGQSVIKYVIEVDEDGDGTAGSSGLFYARNASAIVDRNVRSAGAAEVVTFNVDHPFIAVVATKGKMFFNLLTMNFNGYPFLPSGNPAWE